MDTAWLMTNSLEQPDAGCSADRCSSGRESAPEETDCPEAWVRRAQQGCQDSFARLVEHYGARVYNYLYQMTRNAHDAEDLTQDTFLKAYRGLWRCNHPDQFVAWLLTIARRTGLNHFRAARPTEPIDPEHHVDPNDPATLTADHDDHRRVWEIARTLKPKQFEALWLHYAEGLSVAEIARVTARPLIYVRVLLHRARRQFAERLAKHTGQSPVLEQSLNQTRREQ